MSASDRPLPTKDPNAGSASSSMPAASPAKFRLQKVLLIVVPVALIAAAVVAVAGFVDVDRLFADLTRPPLAPVQGRVLFKGQPLRGAEIMTKPSGRGLAATGWTDAEGKFSLKTDIRGNYADGATVGTHQVTVASYQPVSGPGSPPLLSPPAYASMSTTPLTIAVQSGAAANTVEFVLEGDAPPLPVRPALGKGGGKKKAKSKNSQQSPPSGSQDSAQPATQDSARPGSQSNPEPGASPETKQEPQPTTDPKPEEEASPPPTSEGQAPVDSTSQEPPSLLF